MSQVAFKKWTLRVLAGVAVFFAAVIIVAICFLGAKSYNAITRASVVLNEWKSHDWISVSADTTLGKNAIIAAEDPEFATNGGGRADVVRNLIHPSQGHGQPHLTISAARLLAFKVIENETPLNRIYDEISIEFYLAGASKEQALEIIMNKSFLGVRPDGSEVKGFGEAADFYFHQPLKNLTAAQAALVAAMIRSPWRFSPLTHADKALDRRNQVIEKMSELKMISAEQAESAKKEPLLPSVKN